jgi:hypothetical protein
VEPEDKSIPRQRFGKQVYAATDTQATIEKSLGTMFYLWSMHSAFKEDFSFRTGGRVLEFQVTSCEFRCGVLTSRQWR